MSLSNCSVNNFADCADLTNKKKMDYILRNELAQTIMWLSTTSFVFGSDLMDSDKSTEEIENYLDTLIKKLMELTKRDLMTTIQSFNHLINFATAIAEFEGYYNGNSRAYRNNNPGNLKAYNKSQQHDESGFRIFLDPLSGFSALLGQILLNVSRGLTLHQFFSGSGTYSGYAPGQQAIAYINFVAQKTHFDVNTPLEYYISLT